MQQALAINTQSYPSIDQMMEAVLAVWPEHSKALQTRFKEDDEAFLARTEEVASLASTLIGDELTGYAQDYRWMCENFLEEQLHFRRHGDYRLKSFAEAEREVYGKPEYMGRYVRGILLSQVFWKNHAYAIDLFRQKFLGTNKGGDYLEVGPGHGLFFYFAAQNNRFQSLTGWDVSDSSITATRHAMQKFGVPPSRFKLVHQDILASNSPAEQFDAVVISEVLEHLEQPDVALASLHRALRPGGRIFINVPINSPAPDHIYLWRTTEEVNAFVRKAGFEIAEEHALPIAGYTLDYARKHAIDISCVLIGVKA